MMLSSEQREWERERHASWLHAFARANLAAAIVADLVSDAMYPKLVAWQK